MTKEPMPWQLTAGQLRQALRDVPDEVVVILQVPPPGVGHRQFIIFCNLSIEHGGGMIFRLVPESAVTAQAIDST